MSDIDKALAYVHEDIELSTSLGDDDDLAEMRRIEVLLMKQVRMAGEWDAIRDELKAMADKVQEVAERYKALEEALKLARDCHGKTLLTDPPQDAWKARMVDQVIEKVLRGDYS